MVTKITNQAQKKNFHRHYNPRFNNKPKAVSYLKSFDTFEDGFTEVLRFNPELKNYCGDTPIYDTVITSMMEAIKNDMPSPSNPNYPNTLSMSIDSGEVGFKTDINIAVGWRIAYNYHEAKSFYKFRVTFISVPSYKKEIIADMEEAGWSKFDPEYNKQKKYWDKVEGINHSKYNNKKKPFHKKEEAINPVISEETAEEVKNNIDEAEKEEVVEEQLKEESAPSVEEKLESENKENTEVEAEQEEATKDVKEDSEENFVMPKTHEEAVKFFAEKDMFHSHQWENPETHKIETITAEEAQEYAGHKNKSVNSITKASVDGVFIVTHNGVSKVVNMNDNQIPGILIDKENGIIAYPDGTKFDINNLTVIE